MRKSTNITMLGTPTFIRIYENPGRERDEYPIAVALDHHEPVALFTERAYALPFAMSLPDILELENSVVEDSTSSDSSGGTD
ncbi:hypothetical protein [Microcella sp.]|uniref:hypothetical protein n=1 Tax=Microcella sp. TaxID=1913979 RepID=UPI00391D4C6A